MRSCTTADCCGSRRSSGRSSLKTTSSSCSRTLMTRKLQTNATCTPSTAASLNAHLSPMRSRSNLSSWSTTTKEQCLSSWPSKTSGCCLPTGMRSSRRSASQPLTRLVRVTHSRCSSRRTLCPSKMKSAEFRRRLLESISLIMSIRKSKEGSWMDSSQ
jgi:hypothetical protein